MTLWKSWKVMFLRPRAFEYRTKPLIEFLGMLADVQQLFGVKRSGHLNFPCYILRYHEIASHKSTSNSSRIQVETTSNIRKWRHSPQRAFLHTHHLERRYLPQICRHIHQSRQETFQSANNIFKRRDKPVENIRLGYEPVCDCPPQLFPLIPPWRFIWLN